MWIIENYGLLFNIVSGVVTVAAAVAAATPTPTDDGYIAKVRGVIDFLAFNFGNAKNRG
jgi:hypothetical protein